MREQHTCNLCQRGDGRGGNGKGGERMGHEGRPRQGGDGEWNAGHGRRVERRAVEGRFSKQSCDSASEVSHVACRPQAAFPPNAQII